MCWGQEAHSAVLVYATAQHGRRLASLRQWMQGLAKDRQMTAALVRQMARAVQHVAAASHHTVNTRSKCSSTSKPCLTAAPCQALPCPCHRRSNTRFKDYERSPIGFGVVIFCIAKPHCTELFQRFYDGFAPWGEPNMAIDKGGGQARGQECVLVWRMGRDAVAAWLQLMTGDACSPGCCREVSCLPWHTP